MKTKLFSILPGILMAYMMLMMSCHHAQMQQFTVDLMNSDGTKESYTMYAGSMLLVHDGEMHVVAKAVKGTKDELEMEVTRYTISRDSSKREHTIQKAGGASNRLSKAKSAVLDPSGTVQVTLQSMAMIDTGNKPVGACQGNCCEAKCFSTFCCADPDECKNTPCNCAPPSNCPGTQTGLNPSQFFELFQSGKEMMVFKD